MLHKIETKAHTECAGYFTISTDKRGVIAEFPNLITNGGLNRMGTTNDYLVWCQVGSGSTSPNADQSALVSRIAGSSTQSGTQLSGQATPPYYVFRRNAYRFNPGVATGNIAEVGVGWATTGGLFSRALVLDSFGVPTTISVAADETLDVTYELRFYPKTTDDTGTVTLTGNIGGTYDWVWRPALVSTFGVGSGGWFLPASMAEQRRCLFSNNPIVGVTSAPSGGVSPDITTSPYVTGSFELQFTCTVGLSDANFVGGIRSLSPEIGAGRYQVGFTPAIPKTSNDVLSIILKHSWGRRP